MKLSTSLALLPAALVTAQNVTVPSTCVAPDLAANDTVLYTVPYPYASVLSIIGSYRNLTWSGNPPETVTLNGSDNTVGTARTYDLAGAHVIETLLTYSSPPGGPYYENHNVALLTVPRSAADGGNVTFYFPLDATTVTSACNGMATMFNFTAQLCTNNVTAAQAIVHLLHSTDAMTVGKFLGGQNFTSCAALNTTNTTGPAPTPSTYKGSAESVVASSAFVGLMLIVVAAIIMM